MNNKFEYHPAANIFPMMSAEEFKGLKEDIEENGQLEPILIDAKTGAIIDGRNRYEACLELDIIPLCEPWDGDDPVSFVVSMNLKRRQLSQSQLAPVALEIEKYWKEEARQRQKCGQGGVLLSATLQKANNEPPKRIWAAEKAAATVGIGERYVYDAKRIQKTSPELLAEVQAGTKTIPEAIKIIKTDQRKQDIQQQREDISNGVAQLPSGVFEVISVDPPWPYGTDYDPNGRRSANPYPEMSLEEIGAIQLPANDSCVLWLWTTHKFLKHSFTLLERWGFRDVAILTWVKNRMGLGSWLRSQSEFCIMAVKGKPTIDLTNQTTVVFGDMREHSRKPDEFYEMVNTLCVGRKLDYFSREPREGWEVFGNDTCKFERCEYELG